MKNITLAIEEEFSTRYGVAAEKRTTVNLGARIADELAVSARKNRERPPNYSN